MEELLIYFIKNVAEKNIQLSYLVFFVSSFLQITFPPYPGDIIIVFQGYISTVSSSFKLVSMLATSICGTLLGAYFVYKLGYLKGDYILDHPWIKQLVSKRKNKAKKLFDKYGAGAIFFSKFIPGINTIVILLSGIFKIKPIIAYSAFIAAGLVHNTFLILLGKFLGHNIPMIKKILSSFNIIIVSIVGVIGLALIVYNHLKKQKPHG